MATLSGKKGKKQGKKNNKLSLGEFLTDGNTAVLNQVQVALPVKLDWCDDGDDDDDDRVHRTQVIALPTAPRASRIMNDDSISQHPPFSIDVSNLPYDINEEDLYDIFENVEIISMSLPRDDGDGRRLRGYGYIEFATRNDLLEVLAMPEPMLRNRRVRIGLFNESETKRRTNRYDNFTGDSERPSSGGNWRDRPDAGPRPMDRERRPYNSSYNRDDRDRDRDRERDRPMSEGGSSWRTAERRPPVDSVRPQTAPIAERPKLVLQPRTLPLPELPKPRPGDSDGESERGGRQSGDGESSTEQPAPRPRPTPVPAAKVFGDAKPVDTAAREREIEERTRLEREEERQRRKEEAQAAAAAAAAAAEEQGGPDAEKENMDTEGTGTGTGSDRQQGRASNANEPIANWRVRSANEDEKGKASEERRLSPSRKFSPSGRFNSNRRTDDRKTDNHRDNRGMNRSTYSNGTPREYTRNSSDQDRMDRGGRDRAYPPRDGAIYRNGDTRDRREQPTKPAESEKEREPKVLEERMPKFQEPTGPNLSMTNTFEGLSADEIDD